MLGRVRLRLTLIFILITSIVYLVTSGCGVLRFWIRINNALDEEISSLATETITHVTCRNGRPFLEMNPTVFHQSVSMQIYDQKGLLLQIIGAKGVPNLMKEANEVRSTTGQEYRNKAIPLPCDKLKLPGGYLQIQVTTRQRDLAIHNYIDNVLLLAPLLLIGLAIAGSHFAGWCVRPIQQSIYALRRFLADAGHELGTPLAILRSTADNLALDVTGIPAAEERVEILTKTTERMAALVSDMALLASLETAEVSLIKRPLQLDVILSDLVNSFKELFLEKGLLISCNSAKNVMINGDKGSIERTISNLLQNAIRYTDEGGTITVQLSVKENTADLLVGDTGIGIPPEALSQIFVRFYRVEKARSRAAGGSGLGLAIVKATVEAHGGTVEVESKVGEGTKFIVSLPVLSKTVTSSEKAKSADSPS